MFSRTAAFALKYHRTFATLDKVIFTSAVRCLPGGGREGGVVESIGDSGSNLRLALEKHVDHGGVGNATNPEELFAAGYSACFNASLQFMATQHKIKCGDSTTIAAVDFGLMNESDGGGVGLAVTLDVEVQGVDQATAEQLAGLAHNFCPYSKATRGNIDVDIVVNKGPTTVAGDAS